MKRFFLFCLLFIVGVHFAEAQIPGLEAKNWYFGTGTDGFVFDPSNIPYKVSNKMSGVGFEGMIVVNDPLSGALLFYSDGQTVVTNTHAVMFNGTGLFGHMSGAQTVQCVPMPNNPGKFYLITSRAWDLAGDNLFYSVVDFTDPGYPLGKVTNKNTLISSTIYAQANKVISKPNTTDYWWIGHVLNTNQFHIISITGTGFSAPITYTATGTNSGDSYTMAHSPISNKVASSGTIGLVMMDFNSTTGVLSNPQQVLVAGAALGNFSPDGTKLYFGMNVAGYKLHQYDLGNGVVTNMNTCCYAHDTKTGPDGKMYHIHTYSSSTPIAVINNPNLTAVGNACGYNAVAPTIVGLFNGHSRRFPEFVVMPQVPILGAEFTSFDAAQVGQSVLLNWSISETCAACAFEVERGNGKGTYKVVGSISSTSLQALSFEDKTAGQSNWFYRIKLIDADGKFYYSEIKEVGNGLIGDHAFTMFPNPCRNELNVALNDPNSTGMLVELLDLAGRKLFESRPTQATFKVDVLALSKGVYILKLSVDGKVVYGKFKKE